MSDEKRKTSEDDKKQPGDKGTTSDEKRKTSEDDKKQPGDKGTTSDEEEPPLEAKGTTPDEGAQPLEAKGTTPDEVPPLETKGTTSNEVPPLEAKGTTSNEVPPLKAKGTTSNVVRPLKAKGTTSREVPPLKAKGTTSHEVPPLDAKGTTSNEVPPLEAKGTTPEMPPLEAKGTTSDEVPPLETKGTTPEMPPLEAKGTVSNVTGMTSDVTGTTSEVTGTTFLDESSTSVYQKRTQSLVPPSDIEGTTDLHRSTSGLEPELSTFATRNMFEKREFIVHPVQIRLNESSAFCVTTPKALVGAGFMSLLLGMFSLFRITPTVLLSVIIYLGPHNKFVHTYEHIFLACIFTWAAIPLVILFVLGLVQTLSVRIKNRRVLLLHPWGLLLLYFDVFFWLCVTIILHVEFGSTLPTDVAFGVVYLDIIFFFLAYYAYATYFMVAELTVIEKFY